MVGNANYDDSVLTVVETASYIAAATRAGLTEADMAAIVDAVAANPTLGDLIQGAGAARKLRWALPGRGKSGGVRVITLFVAADGPVYLVGCYAKSRKADLTAKEVAALAEMAGLLKRRG